MVVLGAVGCQVLQDARWKLGRLQANVWKCESLQGFCLAGPQHLHHSRPVSNALQGIRQESEGMINMAGESGARGTAMNEQEQYRWSGALSMGYSAIGQPEVWTWADADHRKACRLAALSSGISTGRHTLGAPYPTQGSVSGSGQ